MLGLKLQVSGSVVDHSRTGQLNLQVSLFDRLSIVDVIDDQTLITNQDRSVLSVDSSNGSHSQGKKEFHACFCILFVLNDDN